MRRTRGGVAWPQACDGAHEHDRSALAEARQHLTRSEEVRADVDRERRVPIVGARALHSDPVSDADVEDDTVQVFDRHQSHELDALVLEHHVGDGHLGRTRA